MVHYNLPTILKHYQGLGVSIQSDIEFAEMEFSRFKGLKTDLVQDNKII